MSVTKQEIYGGRHFNGDEKFELNMAHLYGDLLNTYGDNGNVLMFRYIAEKLDVKVNFEIVSLGDEFDSKKYDMVFFGGGQDYEQRIVSKDFPTKREEIIQYIEQEGVLLSICGGYQLLGQYFIEANGNRVDGIGALPHYTLNQTDSRFVGDVEIVNEDTGEHYYGFENHQGRTFLGEGQKPLGKLIQGKGNNGEDGGEGMIYKNTYGSYFHGPILSRNTKLAYRLVVQALKNRYGAAIQLASWQEILGDEETV
jgi:CobQ-like glutamine amidotransferase family enzyme